MRQPFNPDIRSLSGRLALALSGHQLAAARLSAAAAFLDRTTPEGAGRAQGLANARAWHVRQARRAHTRLLLRYGVNETMWIE